MQKFIQIMDVQGSKRLINIDHISDIVDSIIYLDCAEDGSQIKIYTKHSYETLLTRLSDAGVDIYT